MKREICVPEVPASQMVLTIITDEHLEAFADAVITKYQQTIVRRKASEPSPEEWMTRLHNDQVGPAGISCSVHGGRQASIPEDEIED